ncbi:ATP-binding protein [bacterium]|nr:ATP-binding protein [bacterium]
MISPGLRPESIPGFHSDVHATVWSRLSSLVQREGEGPAEILLHGPMGVGKTILLRRLYWDLFHSQDFEVPVFSVVTPGPFRPLPWVRRFLMEAALQWMAFEYRDAEMVRSNLPPLSSLVNGCRDVRLYPLADALENLERLETSASDGVFLVEWAFDALSRAARRTGTRLILLMDGADYAVWSQRGDNHALTRTVPPLGEGDLLRRIWSSRFAPQSAHPYLPPAPSQAEDWALAPLNVSLSLDFFASQARQAGLDYDPQVLGDYITLWGGIPRWLANYVRQASEYPRSLTEPDHFLQPYVADVLEGPTARDLQDALQMAVVDDDFDPSLIARTAFARLASSDHTPNILATPPSAEEEKALRRLARGGLAIYRQGRWEVPGVPVLEDFLDLYTARHHRGENLVRREVSLKRRRLVETPRRTDAREIGRKRNHLVLMMHAFRGQEVPDSLLHSANRIEGEPLFESEGSSEHAHTQAAGLARAAASATRSAGMGKMTRLPYCIGAFPLEMPSRPPDIEGDSLPGRATGRAASVPRLPDIPAVLGWCFQEPECYRSDETLWVAYLCAASVVTTSEIEQTERTNRRLAREFNVQRVRGWIVSDGRYSAEALEEMEKRGFFTSRWSDCEQLGERVLQRAVKSGSAPKPGRHARILQAASDSESEKVIELLLPPKPDMELVAATSLEQLAGACGFDKNAVGQMKMAVLEACLNAAERSRNSEKMIRVRMEGTPALFTIIVENEGETFDPQLVEEPVLADKMGQAYKRGWGLHLMKKFMDRVSFEPFDRGTRLRMEKRNPSFQSERDEEAMPKV